MQFRTLWKHSIFINALKAIWEYISRINKFIADAKPWAIKDKDELCKVLFSCSAATHAIAYEIAPFLPDTAKQYWNDVLITQI